MRDSLYLFQKRQRMRQFYRLVILLVCLGSVHLLSGQDAEVVRLQKVLATAEGHDRVTSLNELSKRLKAKSPTKAKEYADEALKLSRKLKFKQGIMVSAYFLGIAERDAGRYQRAINRAKESIEAAQAVKDDEGEVDGLYLLKTLYLLDKREGKWRETEKLYRNKKNAVDLDMTAALLKETEEDYASKEKELRRSRVQRNRLAREKEEVEDMLSLTLEEKLTKEAELARLAQDKAELELAQSKLENEAAMVALEIAEKDNEILAYDAQLKDQRFWTVVLTLGLISALLIIGLLYRNYRLKQQSMAEKIRIQRQLMLQEKMATLGQLTAGIAHEIKNPLNFVNNFAEGSVELSEELAETLGGNKDKLDADDYELGLEIITDLKQNALDILTNGQRADRIINSMMEHARGDKGVPQLTDVNTLVADNMNLAYHGYRALHTTFSVDIKTQFEEDLPKIKVIPQDLSRVILNIINNACYALNKKQRKEGAGFSPQIKLMTEKKEDQLILRIRDNGPGIPKEVLAKIFNPFFTTKPTGDGNAGLGLSISYDIIVQGMEGQLEVDSEVDQFTEFIIRLPYKAAEELAPVS